MIFNRNDIPKLESRILGLMNSSKTVVFYCQYLPGWPVLYLTDNFTAFGYTPQQFYDAELNYQMILHPDDLRKLNQNVAEKTKSDFNHHAQIIRMKPKQGDYRHIDIRLTFERDENQQVTHLLGELFDITERIEQEKREKMLVSVIQQTADLVKVTNKDGVLVFVNQALIDKTGYSEAELLGKTPALLKSELAKKTKSKALWETILAGKVYKNIIVNRCRDGSTYSEETTITPIFDDSGEIEYFVSTGKDVSEQVRLQKAMKDMAMKDTLTGIHNRRYLQSAIEAEMKRVNRYDGGFGLIMIDIDYFKEVNDKYGHDVGDSTLTQIAEVLTSNTRETDFLSRWGGEEFMILALDLDLTATMGLAEKIRQAVEALTIPKIGHITASFGATVYHKPETAKQLFKRVDEALYTAKRNGRNRVELY